MDLLVFVPTVLFIAQITGNEFLKVTSYIGFQLRKKAPSDPFCSLQENRDREQQFVLESRHREIGNWRDQISDIREQVTPKQFKQISNRKWAVVVTQLAERLLMTSEVRIQSLATFIGPISPVKC